MSRHINGLLIKRLEFLDLLSGAWSSLLRDGYKVKEWMSRLEEDEWPGHEERSQLSGHSSKDSWEGTNRLASYASLVPFLMWSRGIWSLFLASHHQETIFSRCRRAIGFSSSARITYNRGQKDEECRGSQRTEKRPLTCRSAIIWKRRLTGTLIRDMTCLNRAGRQMMEKMTNNSKLLF